MNNNPVRPAAFAADNELALAFARCFRGPDGERVIDYLRQTTLGRALGPAATDSLLRHTEGQRQLVARILALIERGRQNADNSQLM